jgi:hypothetical protein
MKPALPVAMSSVAHPSSLAVAGALVFVLFVARDIWLHGVPTLLRLWGTRN